jgi:cyclic beta-1,2-glucan synthetase
MSIACCTFRNATSRRKSRISRIALVIASLAFSAIACWAYAAKTSSSSTPAGPSSYTLMDARERGGFDIGSAVSGVTVQDDREAGRDVIKFDFQVAAKSYTGVFTKKYPKGLKPAKADALKLGVKTTDPELIKQVAVKVEIKGSDGAQYIPLTLKNGWSYYKQPINWGALGKLTEIVFVVSPTITSGQVEGILLFDAQTFKLTLFQKYCLYIKIGIVFAAGLLLALLAGLLHFFVRRKGSRSACDGSDSVLSIIKRDLLYGVVTVIIAGVAVYVYNMGTVNPLDEGFNFNFLAIGLIGAAAAGLLKLGITGKLLTPGEIFMDTVVTGLLAVSSSNMDILQAPGSWEQVLLLNSVMATLAIIVFHAANGASLANSGRHLKPISGLLIFLMPYTLNWLMVSENVGFLSAVFTFASGGFLAKQPAVLTVLGRMLVVFVFNELFVNGISLATNGKLLKTLKAHTVMLLVALFAAVASLIADAGSTEQIASLAVPVRALIVILTSMLSFGGLWAEVYLITGVALDGGKRNAPTDASISGHVLIGVKKGMAYSGILMTLLYALSMMLNLTVLKEIMGAVPLAAGMVAGALLFPLAKNIIETFDGSLSFFARMRYSYRDVTLYARGAVVGLGFGYALSNGFIQQEMHHRCLFGLAVGLAASAGISMLRDLLYASKNQGKLQSWRLYVTDALMGAFVGSAAAFYLDALQVPVIVEKFKLYTSAGFEAKEYITFPLLNKWGRIDLGTFSGGAKLLYTESLAGVINWSIAAWLFAVNKVFLQSLFEKHVAPIKNFFSKEGFGLLVENMIYVLRWGLWMSPIIFTFLRMMPDPTWYNQDGAVRTLCAIYNDATMSPEAFREWSLKVFVWILAYDFVRVLIWMDHMGLRVATLVNLSFIGLDRLDERLSRWIGPAAAQRYIPEGVKRFATWAPLLIPFFLPRGKEWEQVWNTAEAIQNAATLKGGGVMSSFMALGMPQRAAVLIAAVILCAAVSCLFRALQRRSLKKRLQVFILGNKLYRVFLKQNGEIFSEYDHKKPTVYPKEYDITRRSYDAMHPCGRALFLVDSSGGPQRAPQYWPVAGNFPHDMFEASRIERGDNSLKIVNTAHGIRTTVEITLPEQFTPAEIWNITIENTTGQPRQLKVVPYCEWVLNGGLHDRFHTQYTRLSVESEYQSGINAILAWQRSTKSMGVLASSIPTEGFQTARMDFVGRAQSIWRPRILETMAFMPARDTEGYPTFDPIGSLLINTSVGANGTQSFRLMIGCAKNKKAAVDMIAAYLKPEAGTAVLQVAERKKKLLIGHGEILPGTPQPYSTYTDGGNKLLVHTPFTPRPYDHAMSNPLHSVMVTNRGLHTSCNGNSQQNRLTPDWPDFIAQEVPSEAVYLYDTDSREWFSPGYHPLNDISASYESEFGVDGTAVLRMSRGTIATELTVFVPPEDPLGVYLLTVKNNADKPRKIRVAPYFAMVLEFMPERSGSLQKRYDASAGALFYKNPRNMFRTGWAFASMSLAPEAVETNRGRFFGSGRGVAHPYFAEHGTSDVTAQTDSQQIAGMAATMEIPAHQERTVAIIMGQTDRKQDADRLVRKYKSLDVVRKTLDETRKWWLGFVKTVTVETSNPQFNYLQNWLKYQALAERIWARRGFYQTSGAFGFRDQLQDTVNLMWVDPALARKQILLHASQQFLEGDVFHWFFTLTDGRTAFSCRTHASDNPAWLPWAMCEYIRATNDYSILDERTSYVWSEFPFADLPKNQGGIGHLYHRCTREDTLYKHCMRSMDLILKKRMGKNGLPLMRTGDWNDGLDEIGSHGKGESVWLGFFVYYILKDMVNIIEKKEGTKKKEDYVQRMKALGAALERTWREDRYLRAINDEGVEIGIKGSGIWEIDALNGAWAVMADINFDRAVAGFNTALSVLERENVILLGWPALREDSKPYLGRSSKYPEGVRENGMYSHGVQWLVRAARLLSEKFAGQGNQAKAQEYRDIAYRLWSKVSPMVHVEGEEIECYGGQPNKQAADMLTKYDVGRMIWHGYTGAAGWMVRQAIEGVVGATLVNNEVILPGDLDKPRGGMTVNRVLRDVGKSPLKTQSRDGAHAG